jgi:hypothetical protein
MGTVTKQPTSNTTPDAGQGGAAVTGNTNTGHASTTTTQVDMGTTSKTCLWTGFLPATGTITSVTLKVDWAQDGTLSDGGAGTSNQFTIDYSTNSGGAWSSLRNATQIQASSSGTSQVSLSTTQDLTTVRVRDALIAAANAGETATMTATISNIRIEVVTTGGGQPGAGMM